MLKLKLNEIHLIFFFTAYFLLSKLYFLYFNPINIGSNVVALNTHIFYNAKSFEFLPQSFHDWNHPGTPFYYLTNLISILIGGLHIKNLEKFLFISHIFLFLINIFSIYYFVNFIKKSVGIENLLIFLLIIFSFDTNLLGIENVDYTSLQLPITLLLLIFSIKTIENPSNKNIFLLSLILSFSISIIMVFLPFVISIFLVLFTKLILISKKINNFILFVLFFICGLIIFNFPIIGRIPKILYNVLFSREDTTFNILESFQLLQNSLIYLFSYNFFLFFLIVIFLFFVILETVKRIYVHRFNFFLNSKNLLIGLITFFFVYTLIVASKDTNQQWDVQGIFFRNTYVYSSFIGLLFFWIKNGKFYNSSRYFIIYLCLFSFLLTNYNYISKRNNILEINNQNNLKFYNSLKKYVSSTSKILIYSDTGYAYENFNILSRANSVFAGDKFTHELIDEYPNLRYLRIHDIVHNNFKKLSNVQKNYFYDKFDQNIKKLFPYKLYLILSHKSYHETGGSFSDPKRSKDIYIKKSNEKKDEVDLVVFNNSHIIQNIDVNKIISFIKTKSKLTSDDKFKIGDDYWYIIY